MNTGVLAPRDGQNSLGRTFQRQHICLFSFMVFRGLWIAIDLGAGATIHSMRLENDSETKTGFDLLNFQQT